MHERGFAKASVRDIVQAASVPQGSFTNHFASKEAFGLEILDRYFTNAHKLVDATLLNDSLPPMARLRQYFDGYVERQRLPTNLEKGCLYGNFAIECSEDGEAIRERLEEIFIDASESLAYCLRAAVAAGELKPSVNCNEVAGFIVSSTQGAVLLSKVYRSVEPLERFARTLFTSVLAEIEKPKHVR
jgi:TetR/AcrR family transcriptional regulator, transcriptional repressor for nem operon